MVGCELWFMAGLATTGIVVFLLWIGMYYVEKEAEKNRDKFREELTEKLTMAMEKLERERKVK